MELNEDLKLNELQIVCHCCLTVCSGLESLQILDAKRSSEDKLTTVSQLYAECVGSEIKLDDDVPLKICQQCYEKLNELRLFRIQCLRALNILNSLKKKKKPSEVIITNNELEVPNDMLPIKEEPDTDAQDAPRKITKLHPSISPHKTKKQKDELIDSSHKLKKVTAAQDPGIVQRKYKKRSSLPIIPKDKKKKINRPVMCQICGKMQTNMTVHMQIHSEKRSFECDLCGKRFTQKMNLNTHLTRAHVSPNIRRFTCEICGYAFIQKSVMQSHMLIHSNTKVFACDMCPSTFIQQYRLNDHRLSHIQERKFACPHCDKAFVRNSGLRNHIGIHTGQRPYDCFFCNKTFLNTSSATMHRKIHRIDDEYVCPVCVSYRTGDLRIFKLHWHQDHQRTPGEMKSIGEMMYSNTGQSSEYDALKIKAIIMSFAGSVFFSDSKFLQNQAFLSKEYDIPLFINSKFLRICPDRRWRNILKRQMGSYQRYYQIERKCSTKYEAAVDRNKLNDPHTFKERFQDSNMSQLPPTRYTIRGNDLADIVQRKTGTKGPYECFTVSRDASTIIGHATRDKFKGSRTMFYDVPGEIDRLKNPRNYFRMKIRHGSRAKQVPYLRFMLQDLTLCPRDPKQPGPAHFYPQNYCLRVDRKIYKKSKRPGSFFPRSCVPENDRFWLNRAFVPGPGRYNAQPVACPCVHHRINSQKPCEKPYFRLIGGHGHTWVFRSEVRRLLDLPRPSDTKIRSRTDGKEIKHMKLDAKYIKIVAHPVRTPISVPINDFSKRATPSLRFNSMERPPKRSKLRNNKKVCFMSGCSRFPVEQSLFAKSKTEVRLKKSPNIPVIKNVPRVLNAKNAMAPVDRLQVLPRRYEIERKVLDKRDSMRYTFAALPPPRVLIEGNVGRTEGVSLDTFYKPLKMEFYNKDEFLLRETIL